ncbi:hypothetical protein NPIL_206141 [Nephila pilipes]|uniref:Uncharacterized protein n=1 Tax=Nephila pilipes TaxID=299642 RepID=A0A8X6MVH1_NEPPI|nr:hypothetical protein NPIL_206141 [Nephila pilipes]
MDSTSSKMLNKHKKLKTRFILRFNSKVKEIKHHLLKEEIFCILINLQGIASVQISIQFQVEKIIVGKLSYKEEHAEI